MKTPVILMAATLLATPALAQTTTTPQSGGAPAAVTQTKPTAGQWRASKLIGVDVYNPQNEKIGEIDELIISSNGQIVGAVIGVGGFLGIGERDVMIPMERLTFSNENASTTGSGSGTTPTPGRAMVNANKDQLRQMPEYKY